MAFVRCAWWLKLSSETGLVWQLSASARKKRFGDWRMEKARLPILQSSKWSILRRCDGRPARCEPGGSETAEVHRANSHSTWRNGQRAPARRRGRRRPARSDGTRSSDARGVARRGADGVVHSYDGRRRRVRSDQKDARRPQRFQACAGVRGGELQLAARTFGLRRRNPAVARAPPSSARPSPLLEDILLSCVCTSVTFLTPLAGGTDRRVGSNPLRSARSSWRRARARRRDRVDAVRAGAPEREK